MNKIQVIIVSQQVLFRQGIEHSLSRTRDIQISATADVSDEVLSIIDNLPPDVALLDIDTPSDNGLKLARRIKQRLPTIGVVLLASNPDDAQLFPGGPAGVIIVGHGVAVFVIGVLEDHRQVIVVYPVQGVIGVIVERHVAE